MQTSVDPQLGVASQGGGVSVKQSFLGEVFLSVPLATFPGWLESLFLSPMVKVTLFLELTVLYPGCCAISKKHSGKSCTEAQCWHAQVALIYRDNRWGFGSRTA